jgi:hypothetical protein
LAPTASASESPLDQYQRTGTINPCNPGIYSGGAAPNDVQQYAPDYLQALQDARRKGCASGGGGGGGGTSTAAAASTVSSGPPPSGPSGTAPGTAYVPKPPAPPKVSPSGAKRLPVTAHLPLAAKSDGGTPAPIVALAIMLLIALAAGAAAAARRLFGWRMG